MIKGSKQKIYFKGLKGENLSCHKNTKNATDKMFVSLFWELFCDITNVDSGKRIFFTIYSLGYREGLETGEYRTWVVVRNAETMEKNERVRGNEDAGYCVCG